MGCTVSNDPMFPNPENTSPTELAQAAIANPKPANRATPAAPTESTNTAPERRAIRSRSSVGSECRIRQW